MANYAVTKEAIENVIKANGNNEITGQLLQNVLIAMIDALGADCQFVGVATPETNPGTPDQNVAYLAGPGTYPNFGPTTVEVWQIGIFKYDGVWNYTVIDTNLGDNCININQIAKHAAAYESFGDAIADVPEKFRKSGCIVVYKDAEMYGEWIAAIFDDSVNMWENEASWRSFGPVNADFDYETNDYVIYIGRELIMRVIDNLISTSRGASLSANQGRILNEKIVGYDNIVAEITTTPVNLSHVILEGDVITSFSNGVTKLIFGRGSAYQDTINASDLPYKVTHNYFDVATESGTLQNVTIHVRGDIFHSFLNVNVFNGQTAAYGSAALARAAVPVTERFVGLQITYLLADGWFTDQYIGSDISGWGTASNWIELGPVSFEKNATTGHVDFKIGSQIISIPSLDENEIDVKGFFESEFLQITPSQKRVYCYYPFKAGQRILVEVAGTGITNGANIALRNENTEAIALQFKSGEKRIITLDSDVQYMYMAVNNNNLYADGTFILRILFGQYLKDYEKTIEENHNTLQDITDLKVKNLLVPFEQITGQITVISPLGKPVELTAYTPCSVLKYNVTGGRNYTFTTENALTIWYVITWLDNNGNVISQEYKATTELNAWTDEVITAPENATQMWMNVRSTAIDSTKFKEVTNEVKGIDELTKNTQRNTDNILTTLQQIVDLKNLIPIEVTDIINDNYIADGEVGTVPELVSSITFSIKKFSITGGKPYAFSSMRTSSTALPFVLTWIDANGKIVLQEYQGSTEESIYWTDKAIFAPSNATELWMTCRNISSAIFNQSKLKDITDDLTIKSEVEQNTNDVEAIKNSMTKSDYTILESSSTIANSYVKAGTAGSTPELMQVNSISVRKYAVIGGNNYAFNSVRSRLDTTYIITWINEDGKIISQEYVVSGSSGDTFWNKEQVVAPINAVEMWMNVESTTPSRIAYSEFMSVSKELVDVVKLEDTVQTIQEEIGYKITPMKVVVNALEGEPESVPFYIRARYDDEKDIIITHRINSNGILSFKETYIGPNVLNDADLINNNFLISSHTDSTGPLGGGSYWALFAQHGYAIPVINNSVGMSANDVGAEWKDQLNRHFIIGKVTGSNIFLLPVIYQDAHGHYIRDWRSTTLSDDITTLIHVSGGVYTSTFNVAATNQVQLYPIMQHNNRKWFVDKSEITKPGTYYGETFSVSETQIGYDPETVDDWFGADDKPDLTNAEPLCVFTYSFNYCGAQCCINTTIDVKKEVCFQRYGGIQQQFFLDTVFEDDNYNAMIMIPKAAQQGSTEVDKPFHSGNTSDPSYLFYRDGSDLQDINNPIDRQIGFLQSPNTGKYLIGMAAGLSLVSGDTVTSKRIQNCLIGNTTYFYLGSVVPNLRNKFYIAAINPSRFEDNDFFFPANYFKEINYYVSYFNPADNVGQVYWYKDGSKYIIYAHCQSQQINLAINIPAIMEGRKLTIVEKTSDTDLLTDTVQNGKFFVNYNTNNANYIVLVAE